MVARFCFPTCPRSDLEKLGTEYGGKVVPTSLLSDLSTCYCAGVGEDISFDLALINRFGCNVYAFDPTPRSIAYVTRQTFDESRFHFQDIGLWSKDQTMKFYAPRNPSHVSHSVVNLFKTKDYFEGRVGRLSTIMSDNGHDQIDLLKLDIEGAQYEVLGSMINDRLSPRILCVEFDQPTPFRKTWQAVRELDRWGYQLVSIDRWDFTFVRDATSE
jgi:FkbM family methyltransferase